VIPSWLTVKPPVDFGQGPLGQWVHIEVTDSAEAGEVAGVLTCAYARR
jgi:hypothetical protein